MPTKYVLNASSVSSGSQVSKRFLAFSPAKTSVQAIFFLPAELLLDRGVEDPHAGAPDVRARCRRLR
jgi:hypothetical protein